MRSHIVTLLGAAGIAAMVAAEGLAAQQGGRGYVPPPQQDRYNQGYEDGYEEGYRAGYRRGYDDRNANRRYNDTPQAAQPDPNELWTRAYGRVFTVSDDIFYRECRNQPQQPLDGAALAGAILGGVLQGQQGAQQQQQAQPIAATDPRMIVTGNTGTQMLRNLNCDDRGHAYRSYLDSFTLGRVNTTVEWRNIRTNRRGIFLIERFYNDQDGFRCADFSQTTFIAGRAEVTRGRACQQPIDLLWVVL
jgi:surface antigen